MCLCDNVCADALACKFFPLIYVSKIIEEFCFHSRAEKELNEHLAVTTSWEEFCRLLENKRVSSCCCICHTIGKIKKLSSPMVCPKKKRISVIEKYLEGIMQADVASYLHSASIMRKMFFLV